MSLVKVFRNGLLTYIYLYKYFVNLYKYFVNAEILFLSFGILLCREYIKFNIPIAIQFLLGNMKFRTQITFQVILQIIGLFQNQPGLLLKELWCISLKLNTKSYLNELLTLYNFNIPHIQDSKSVLPQRKSTVLNTVIEN